MEFDLNDTCRVRLTKIGKEVYELYENEIGMKYRPIPDVVEMQAWALMRIFGAHMSVGFRGLFVDNKIDIESTANAKYSYIRVKQSNIT
jgi:hypothetical protein